MSKHTIGAGDASRHAQNIGTSPPQVQSTLCPRCRPPAILMRAGRCLTVARVVRASKAEPQVSPSPCIWCCKQRVEHFAVLIYLPSMRLTAILKGWRRFSLTIHWQYRSRCHHRIVDCSTCLRPQFRDGVFEYACDMTRGGVRSAPCVAPRAPLVFAKRIRPAWSCVLCRVFHELVSRWTSDLPDEAAAPPLGISTNSSPFLPSTCNVSTSSLAGL